MSKTRPPVVVFYLFCWQIAAPSDVRASSSLLCSVDPTLWHLPTPQSCSSSQSPTTCWCLPHGRWCVSHVRPHVGIDHARLQRSGHSLSHRDTILVMLSDSPTVPVPAKVPGFWYLVLVLNRKFGSLYLERTLGTFLVSYGSQGHFGTIFRYQICFSIFFSYFFFLFCIQILCTIFTHYTIFF